MSNDTSAIKILILTANPKGTDKLRLDEEARKIKESLRQASKRDQFNIDSEWAVRPRDIRRTILYSQPQIVHFSGHGEKDGGLAFENEMGQVQLVQPDALAGLFKLFSEKVECVILNACYSENQADAIARHIDFVIGMTKEISDRAAIEFAVGFYEALGAGRSVKIAYEFGCNAIKMEGMLEHLTPILKCKGNSSVAQGITDSNKLSSVKDTKTHSPKLDAPSRTIYEFVLTGSIDEVSKEKLEVIVAHLQKITGDTSLTLLKIESSSIKLVLEGSEQGFQLLQSLVASGKLKEILEIPVQKVSRRELQTSHLASFSSPILVKQTASFKQKITKNKRKRSLASTINDRRNHLRKIETYIWQLGCMSQRSQKIIPNSRDVNELFEISMNISRTLRNYLNIEDIFLDDVNNELQLKFNYDSTHLENLAWLRKFNFDQRVADNLQFYIEQERNLIQGEKTIQDLLDAIFYFQPKIKYCYNNINAFNKADCIIRAVLNIAIGAGLVCEGILSFCKKHSGFDISTIDLGTDISTINLGATMFINGTNDLLETLGIDGIELP
jgi:hypothetical protein